MATMIFSAITIILLNGNRANTIENTSIFRKEQIVFSSPYNITNILVPADGVTYVNGDSEIPSIFFTISDPTLDGGSCIYVLEGLAAYEILEGGRDTTSDYGQDRTIYFGAKNGVYKYDPESLSAKKFGPFTDDIIQIQKCNNLDDILFLNSEHKLFKLEKNGTVKTRMSSIACASQFVLDTSNNIYYISCDDGLPHIVKSDGKINTFVASVIEDFKHVKLLRPAFVMENCVPFFADGYFYILHANGTSDKKDLFIKEIPTAYSVDAALYLVTALDGKIYEFNVMEVLLKSMFGVGVKYAWPTDISKMIMSIIGKTMDGIYKDGFPY